MLLLLLRSSGAIAPPVANFSATPLTGTAALSVQFTDLSTNSPVAWLWDFDDGNTSTEENPLHVYTSAGTYSPSLTVSNGEGTDELTRTNYITVTGPHQCNWNPPVASGTPWTTPSASSGSWVVPIPTTGTWATPRPEC